MSIEDLQRIMVRLRDPENGCPWDKVQTFQSISPYTIEEAYEVAEAIRKEDFQELLGELGDLLLQVVYLSRIAEESELFSLQDVIESICEKMVRRHPHVFSDQETVDATHHSELWEAEKAQERAQKSDMPVSALEGVALALPALLRAHKLQKRAARVGFDWGDIQPACDKVSEEMHEVHEALASGDKNHIKEEVGDFLFAAVNVARHAGVDAEQALRAANHKFERRFRAVESQLQSEGLALEDCDLSKMDAAWDSVKAQEKSRTD